MLQNVEYLNIPERIVYEPRNGVAHLTLADNIHEGVNAQDEPCWYCDLYFMELPDSPNMRERVERAFDKFIDKAKSIAALEARKVVEPDANQRIAALEARKVVEPDANQRIAALEARLDALTAKFVQLSESVTEVVKKDNSDMPRGDYLNPIPYEAGMNVFSGLFYTDGEDIWEALVSGVPSGFDDRIFFDIIG